MDAMERINGAARAIEAACGRSEVGIVLGSGLGDYADTLEGGAYIDYRDVPGFPVSTAPGHAGRWHAGVKQGKRVCLMQGRFHAYEGYAMEDVTLPIRVMQRLGVSTVILTNAAGGVNLDFHAGELMLLNDFINLSGKNPLTGPNMAEFGVRFPDMSHAYDVDLQALALAKAEEMGITLRQGVYCLFNGPSYETPAEIRMARRLGADAVGMSTVPETIVARHCGMRVLGISCITNMAAGVLDQLLDEQEVIDAGRRAKDVFTRLLDGVLQAL